jgi:Beta-lactamase enzyme family
LEEEVAEDLSDVLRRFEESAERVRIQRASPRRAKRPKRGWLIRIAMAMVAMACAVGIAGGGARPVQTEALASQLNFEREQRPLVFERKRDERERWPAEGAAAEAERIAKSREGVISFAAIGPTAQTVSFEPDRQFYSASISKAMLLVAELRRLRREETTLDETTRSLLEQMITLSDNEAADAIFARVGDAGLNGVAAAAGMAHFAGDVGHWSNVQVTAADMALFMSKLDELLDLRYGGLGSEMLASVTPLQRWGIPEAAPKQANVRLKGGWRPSDTGQLVLQAAQVNVGGESYSIAVFTDGNPSQVYGEETIRLIAAQFLRGTEAPK